MKLYFYQDNFPEQGIGETEVLEDCDFWYEAVVANQRVKVLKSDMSHKGFVFFESHRKAKNAFVARVARKIAYCNKQKDDLDALVKHLTKLVEDLDNEQRRSN